MMTAICMVLCCLLALVLGGCRQPTPGQFTYWLGNYQPCLHTESALEYAVILLGRNNYTQCVLRFDVDANGYVCLNEEGNTDDLIQKFCTTLALDETAYTGWISEEMEELYNGFQLTRHYFKTATRSRRIRKHEKFVTTFMLLDNDNEETSLYIWGIGQYLLDPNEFARLPQEDLFVTYSHKQVLLYTDGTQCHINMAINFSQTK